MATNAAAVGRFPDEIAPRVWLTESMIDGGDLDRAREELRALSRLAANDPQLTYLRARLDLAAGDAAAAAETTSVVSDSGTVSSALTGDTAAFVLGKSVAGGSEAIAKWLLERQSQSFDAVFVPAGRRVAEDHQPVPHHQGHSRDGRLNQQVHWKSFHCFYRSLVTTLHPIYIAESSSTLSFSDSPEESIPTKLSAGSFNKANKHHSSAGSGGGRAT